MSVPPGVSFAIAPRNDGDALRNLLAPIPSNIARAIRTTLMIDPGCLTLAVHDARSETAVFLTASATVVQIWSFRPVSSREFTAIRDLIEDADEIDLTLARRAYELATGRDALYSR